MSAKVDALGNRIVADPRKIQSVTVAAKVKRTREQGTRLIPIIRKTVRIAVPILVVWTAGWWQFNVSWVVVGSLVYAAGWEYRRIKRIKKALSIENLTEEEQEAMLARVDELPAWVHLLFSLLESSLLMLIN